MATLTALILAKNEERHISECVASVAFADEVLVIDDFSTDETVALAQASGAKVSTHAVTGLNSVTLPLVRLQVIGFFLLMLMSEFLRHWQMKSGKSFIPGI